MACLLCTLPCTIWAQALNEIAEHGCKGSMTYITPQQKTSVADPAEDNYDIHHLRFQLRMSDTDAYISGHVMTSATAVADMDKYVFELDDTFAIDLVVVNAQPVSFSSDGNVHTAVLPAALHKGEQFKTSVYYHGHPRYADQLVEPGLNNDPEQDITFSLVEPYFAHRWWPCKQSLTDKIDSVDMWITVPTGVKVGSNGVLQTVETTGGGQRYRWQTRYPIDYYLISVAVSRYDEYSYYMHFDDGSNDSMLIMNYISPDTPKNITNLKPWLDSTAILVNYFSDLWGRYPFWKEKYGHCYTPSFVNMEHQTMTTTRFSRLTVLAHELAHQWFGDWVTCGTWKDIWLNEGFASYAQYLCYEHFDGHAVGDDYLRAIQNDVTKDNGGSVYCYDTTDRYRIFDYRLTYNKAASVIHMLRFVVNDDTKFFGMLRDYLNKYATGTATTEDFETTIESYTGINLHDFFQQWIYKEGFPYLTAGWNQDKGKTYIRIVQESSAPNSVAWFKTPIEVLCYSPDGDTTIRMDLENLENVYSFATNKIIDSIAIDPDRWLLYQLKEPTTRNYTLNENSVSIHVFPNPADNELYVTYKGMANASLILYDATGRQALKQTIGTGNGKYVADISLLPPGVYLYRIASENDTYTTGKVVVR